MGVGNVVNFYYAKPQDARGALLLELYNEMSQEEQSQLLSDLLTKNKIKNAPRSRKV